MKKIIAFLLAFVMAFSSLAVVSGAADDPLEKRTDYAPDHATKYILTKEKIKGYDYDAGSYSYTRSFSYDSAYRLIKETQDFRTLSYQYDQNGNVVKHVNKTTTIGEGFDRTEVNYVYDKNGLIVKKTERYADVAGDDYTQKDVYKYKNGRLVQQIDQRTYKYEGPGAGNKMTTVYSYDKNGRLIKTKDSYGNFVKFFYDKKGRISKEVQEYITTYYKYNQNGDLVKKYSKEEDIDMITESHVYKYDKNALLISKHDFYETGTDEFYSYRYDENGNLIKSTHKGYLNDGELYTKETVSYTYKKISAPICRTKEGIRLSAYSYKYNGKAKKPVVSIDGLLPGADFHVTYSDNVKPGKAKVRIDFTDPTIQSVTVVFQIK